MMFDNGFGLLSNMHNDDVAGQTITGTIACKSRA